MIKYVLEQSSEFANSSLKGTVDSRVLTQKMEALTWVVHAAAFLTHKTLTDVINIYRATEIPAEPALLLRYCEAKTGSQAVLSVVDLLVKATNELIDSSGGDVPADEASPVQSKVAWVVQATELLMYNGE